MSEIPPPSFVTPPLPPQPAPTSGKSGTSRRGLGILGTVTVATVTSLIVGGVAGLGGYLIGTGIDQGSTKQSIELPVAQITDTAIEAEISAIAEAVLPSVVSILIEAGDQSGSGSGFVVQSNGYILTNNHVAAPAANGGELTVIFDNGDKAKATIVGRNTSYDLAVLKVD